ncbi:YwbE family protein [Bacillus sp. ISL-41]|uniref:YwbE family protein n=1 Tax=Bacillus sp. ISL-41 TaxID=2819127 RepID=UPI001BE86D7C|nr:YwbE family protein [Bacillus sp. ISL-41]MBT2641289.1 YwbE family protein [Bacillus sp. ISL-41]
MTGKYRNELISGLTVDVVLKKNQRTGILTRGKIEKLLTNSSYHPYGIKVKLQDGQVGRVQAIIMDSSDKQ